MTTITTDDSRMIFNDNIQKLTDNKISIDSIIFDLKNDRNHMPKSRKIDKLASLKQMIAVSNSLIADSMALEVDEELMQIQLSPLMLYMHDIMQFSIFRDINTKINLYKFEILVRANDRNRNLTTYCLDSSIEEASQKVLERYQNVSILYSELIAQVNQELPSSVLTDLIL